MGVDEEGEARCRFGCEGVGSKLLAWRSSREVGERGLMGMVGQR